MCYDDRLRELHTRLARKNRLEDQIAELRKQRHDFQERIWKLRTVMEKEQLDVDKLEGRSLAAFFYNVTGKMDKKLDQERREAYAARVKYDGAARELAAVEADLVRCESELSSLKNCQEEYQAALEEKKNAVKSAGGAAAEELLEMEERLAVLSSRKQELDEAVYAGQTALYSVEQVLNNLDSAEGLGTWDMFGGGLLVDLAKHSHLDEAQAGIESLQSQLRSFKTELADVTVDAEAQVNVDGFLRFADYFFDGIFADWAVMNEINNAQEQVLQTKYQIESILSKLRAMEEDIRTQAARLEEKREKLVLESRIGERV